MKWILKGGTTIVKQWKKIIDKMQDLKSNLRTLLDDHRYKPELEILYGELLDFTIKRDWRGACHESCGVQFVLLNELGISCEWRLGEVIFKERKIHGNPVFFDHSWILIDNEIFDTALYKTNYPSMDSFPTIRNKNLKTMKEPEVIYDIKSGWEDDQGTHMIKNLPLSLYFDNSPVHPKFGTWVLIQQIGRKLGINSSIVDMRQKYNGIYWK